MNLTEIRVRNFRSIEAEQHLMIPGQVTLVGPNNSGKTNILKAIKTLFTGYKNSYGYSRDADLTFEVGKARTSITATFDGDQILDKSIYDEMDELHLLQGTTRSGTQISLTLYFTDANTPVYSFFPNAKRPKANTQAAQYSRTHIALVNKVLGEFTLHYVPSAKSVEQIYNNLLTPFLRRKVSKAIEPYIHEINKSLNEAAQAINSELAAAKLSKFQTSFALPGQSLEGLISNFDFIIEDSKKTSIQEKGMGVQTTALLAAFRWITSQENSEGRKVLWLLEEPESYLHPNLAASCNTILDNLAIDSTVIKTTHSMAFVPQDPRFVKGTKLNEKGRTEIESYKTFTEAVSSIRSALGIKFSDFYNLASFNVFVEGQSDREIFSWILDQLPQADHPLPCLRAAKFEDFGGVKHLSGFLRATYQFIRNEHASVTVFDGDDAGEKERKDLQSYFGNIKIPFEANKHFVSVRSRFAIEGLFPDSWIKQLYSDHPTWFENFAVDASGQLEPFKIKDDRKSNIQTALVAMAEAELNLDWAERFANVCKVIDEALTTLSTKLTQN